MHHLVKKITVVSALTMSCATALATESITTKVLAVDGGLVTLATDKGMPSWLKKGKMVQTSSWQAKVHSVDGKKVVISLPKFNAAKFKVDSSVVVQEFAREESFGC